MLRQAERARAVACMRRPRPRVCCSVAPHVHRVCSAHAPHSRATHAPPHPRPAPPTPRALLSPARGTRRPTRSCSTPNPNPNPNPNPSPSPNRSPDQADKKLLYVATNMACSDVRLAGQGQGQGQG